MGRRVPLRSLSFALALALAVSAVVLAVYDAHGAQLTLAIVAPVGVVTVLAGEAVAGRRPAGLRGQFTAIAALGALAFAVTVALFVDLMFVSSHDALMTILLVFFAAALVFWIARPVGVRALDELDREQRMRAELFAAVSHDLRTPITALSLLATAIDDEVVEDAKRREYAARMNTHVRALGALIDDLFDLTRLEAKELGWTMEAVRLDELVYDAVEAMQPSADAGSVAVRAELRAPLHASHGNHEQLQRVLFNLIQNAIHHTPPDGSVTVRAEDVAGGVEIEVADTGLGIAPGQRERVFEPFYRVDASRTNPGAGLGLAISRAIVEAHGGRIWLEEAEIGTRVRFRLPVSI
jgi:signal transduction histidine kinase